MMTDPIADMLTQIKNALASQKKEVVLPFSKIKFAIGKILEREGYLAKVEQEVSSSKHNLLRLSLKYDLNRRPIIQGLKRVSKPGCRIYVSKEELSKIMGTHGLTIISTSKGLMTGKEAKKQGLGGEVICKVW
jgi:small subunit ribosomal protein S8